MAGRKRDFSRWIAGCVFASVLGAAGFVQAASVSFVDVGAFQTASGGTNFLVDFSGFAVDTPFRDAPVDLGPFTIGRSTGTSTFRNTIDVAPFMFTDNNGTAHASLFVDGDDGLTVTLGFVPGATAFGGSFIGTVGGELLSVRLATSDGQMQVFDISGAIGNMGFFGVVADPNVTILSATFFATTSNGSPAGEGFSLDDVVVRVGAAPMAPPMAPPMVPEPASVGLLGLGVLGLLARRRRSGA